MDDITIAAARLGDRPAQAALLHALQDDWYRLSLSLLRNPERARDAAQETGLRFLKRLPSFRGESQLRTWSLGIAVNVTREIRRRELRAAGEPDPGLADGMSPAPEFAAELEESRLLLREVLDHLPARQREAIVLRYFEDLSVQQTADAMHCAAGTVKATVHQAMRTLRAKLQQLI